MEAAGFAFAVVGMFQTCIKGYTIVSDARNAPRDGQEAARRIDIESSVLHGWGEHFNVKGEPSESNEKLKVYLGKGRTFDGVFSALCAITETFINVRRMSEKYGIVFNYKRRRGEVRDSQCKGYQSCADEIVPRGWTYRRTWKIYLVDAIRPQGALLEESHPPMP